MGELEQPPVPVFITPRPLPGGVPSAGGLLQTLQSEGITKGVIQDSRAQQVNNFVPFFDLSQVLDPVQRVSDESNIGTGAAFVDILLNTITAPANQNLVIRSLAWRVQGGGLLPVDLVEIRHRAKAGTGGLNAHYTFSGPFPISNWVIGDVDSPLTQVFKDSLPFALLPGERLEFVQRFAPTTPMLSELSFLRENYVAPFRPAGL